MGGIQATLPLISGVCSRLGRLFHCNTWVLRAAFVLLFMIKPLWTIAVYAVLAMAFRLAGSRLKSGNSIAGEPMLQSPRLATRNTRIEALDRRFREWERSRKP